MGNDWRVACAGFAQQGHYVDEWFSVVLGVRPVSYTHLDVYKRQGLQRFLSDMEFLTVS